MAVKITRLKTLGFCYGVKRAIQMLEKAAMENKSVDCYGDLVHNSRVMQKLKEQGVRVINDKKDISSSLVAVSAHGLSPQMESELAAGPVKLMDATCPSVKKVQNAAHRLAKSGHTVIVYGDARHIEVQGILGYAGGLGLAALEAGLLFPDQKWPRKIGILSQTTQVPEHFVAFVKAVLERAMNGNSEIVILDTVCQEVRRRQSLSQALAAKSDLVLVVGGKNSANTRRLEELCAASSETHLVESALEIEPAWLKNKKKIGVTSGTSASEETIDEVVTRLEQLTSG
jgi:4-hydroxy-3-methylbut-2-enyl diphosphate reductase